MSFMAHGSLVSNVRIANAKISATAYGILNTDFAYHCIKRYQNRTVATQAGLSFRFLYKT